MPPALRDVVASEATSQVPYKDRRACLGCRAIKSKCMARNGSEACTRCIRLKLECQFVEHRRGVQAKPATSSDGNDNDDHEDDSVDDDDDARSRSRKRRRRSSLVDHDQAATDFRTSPLPPSSVRSRNSAVHMDDDTPAALPSSSTAATTTTNVFSIHSMLSVDPSEATPSASNYATLHSSTFSSKVQRSGSRSPPRTLNNGTITPHHERLTPPNRQEAIIEHIVDAGILTEREVSTAIKFYFVHLNIIVALLDPVLYSEDVLNIPKNHFLLAAICTASSKFLFPHVYTRCIAFLREPLAMIASQDVVPQMQYVHGLPILAMWKHPHDGSSWRKVRTATTMALELGLHRSFRCMSSPSMAPATPYRQTLAFRKLAQRQRTMMHLACFEDAYLDQRSIPVSIDDDWLPEPYSWIEWLDDMALDLDIRLAASRNNSLTRQNLLRQLIKVGEVGSTGKNAVSVAMRRTQLIEVAIAAEKVNARIWLNPEQHGFGKGKQFAGKPCLLFHTANTILNYHRALMSIHSAPDSGLCEPQYRRNLFLECCRLSIELFELVGGSYGEQEYFRYVHDIVILNLAAAAVWICDNWQQMPEDVALQASTAVRMAARVTSSCMDRHFEHGSYLARFMAHCAKRIARIEEQQRQRNQRRHIKDRSNSSAADMHATQHIDGNNPLLTPPESLGNGTYSSDSSSAMTVSRTPNSSHYRQPPRYMPFPVVVGAGANNNISVTPEEQQPVFLQSGDPSLQYLQDLLSVPCVDMDDSQGHEIMSFFQFDHHNANIGS